jgi:hypothetical protein
MHGGMSSRAVFIVKCVCYQEFKKISCPKKFCETLKVLLLFLFVFFTSDFKANNKRGLNSINAFPPFSYVFTHYTFCPVSNVLERTCGRNQHIKMQHGVNKTEERGLIFVPSGGEGRWVNDWSVQHSKTVSTEIGQLLIPHI